MQTTTTKNTSSSLSGAAVAPAGADLNTTSGVAVESQATEVTLPNLNNPVFPMMADGELNVSGPNFDKLIASLA